LRDIDINATPRSSSGKFDEKNYLRKKLESLKANSNGTEPSFVKANKLATIKQMSLNKYRKDYSEIFLTVRERHCSSHEFEIQLKGSCATIY